MGENLLKQGDTIGIVSPSHIMTREEADGVTAGLEKLGFRVRMGAHVYDAQWGYAADARARADDLNDMARDRDVRLILFDGGEGSCELLPYIDYDALRRDPKLLMSYSDGTTILQAVRARTGLVTLYGQAAGTQIAPCAYDAAQLLARAVRGEGGRVQPFSPWRTLRGGTAEGELIGGYLCNFALMLGGDYLRLNPAQDYILFLEDHMHFSTVNHVSELLAHIEQRMPMARVRGLLFGHYCENVPEELLACLARFGERHGIPVVYTDDFGHGERHAILPIGGWARLSGEDASLTLCGSITLTGGYAHA